VLLQSQTFLRSYVDVIPSASIFVIFHIERGAVLEAFLFLGGAAHCPILSSANHPCLVMASRARSAEGPAAYSNKTLARREGPANTVSV
jgi:hypothetical protein